MENIKQIRQSEYDLIRVVAMIQVIALHTLDYRFVKNLCSSCVVLFVMLSGSLKLRDNNDFSWKKWATQLLRLVIVFMITSVCYVLFVDEKTGTKQAVLNILTGNYHLWFLYMIMGCYLCIPILLQIKNDVWIYRLFLIISAVTAIVIPTLDAITNTQVLGYISGNLIGIHMGLGYIVFFVLGDVLCRIRFSGVQTLIIVVTGIVSKALMQYMGDGIGDFDLRQTLLSVAWFVLLLALGRKISKICIINSILAFVSKQCFVVYLIHAAVIVYLQRNGIKEGIYILFLSIVTSFICASLINLLFGTIKKHLEGSKNACKSI